MNDAPLRGKRIVITRAREQAKSFAEKIRARDGIPLLFPTIACMPLQDSRWLDDALLKIETFDWVVFTSANGVRFATARGAVLGIELKVWNDARIAAIGSATARALNELGVRVDFVPTKFTSEQMARELPLTGDERVLLLRADIASNDLANALAVRGAHVFDVDAYRTRAAPRAHIDFSRADAVTFTSPSTVENFFALVKKEKESLDIFCIGPVTANTVRELGLRVTATAREHTLDGLVRVMCEHYEREQAHVISRNETNYAL